MKESLLIQNFGPIKEARIEDIKPLTILIGESGSGKSTIMKVLAMFQWIYKMMCIRSFLRYSGVKKTSFRIVFKSLLQDNGLQAYLRSDTKFEYQNGSTILTYAGELKGTAALVPKNELCLEKIVFMSDKRAIIGDVVEQKAILRRSFYLLDFLDNYLQATDVVKKMNVEFADVCFEIKKTSQGVKHMIVGSDNDRVYNVKLNEASSGMQSSIPVLLIVEYFAKYYDLVKSMNKSILSYVTKNDSITDFRATKNISDFSNKIVNLFIEEPELNLFPEAQRKFTQAIIGKCFAQQEYKLHLTMATHSPYILSAINNMMYAYSVGLDSDKSEKVANIISKEYWINPDDVGVFLVCDGSITNIMDEDLKQIQVEKIDTASTIMNEQYDQILNIEYLND